MDVHEDSELLSRPVPLAAHKLPSRAQGLKLLQKTKRVSVCKLAT